MKKILIAIMALMLSMSVMTSCKDTKDKAKEATENAADAMEEAAEDAVDAMEEAVEETKEAGEAVQNAVDEAIVHLKDNESVTVSYSYTSAGKEIKGSKTFKGHQDEVEKAVQKLSDSIQKIDPDVKITVGN